jgi:multidrug resistance efflux pump
MSLAECKKSNESLQTNLTLKLDELDRLEKQVNSFKSQIDTAKYNYEIQESQLKSQVANIFLVFFLLIKSLFT